jgi:hypothetical protein
MDKEILGYFKELPSVCPHCHGNSYTVDTGGNKHPCVCQRELQKTAIVTEVYHYKNGYGIMYRCRKWS